MTFAKNYGEFVKIGLIDDGFSGFLKHAGTRSKPFKL